MKKLALFCVCILALGFFAGCGKQSVKQNQDLNGEAKDAVLADEPSVREDSYKDSNLEIVNFDFDKSDLTDEAKEKLKRNATYLISPSNRDLKIVIEGHTDNRGTIAYNMCLGDERAKRVRKFYVLLGVESGRIATISYGKEKPANINNDELGWAENRRAETKVLAK
ncbi:MAG: OmpA family protein [Endomicrobium sp.]|nr:OmpA family protein [Endomicrobium sp.]